MAVARTQVTASVLRRGDAIQPLEFPDVSVAVSDILGGEA